MSLDISLVYGSASARGKRGDDIHILVGARIPKTEGVGIARDKKALGGEGNRKRIILICTACPECLLNDDHHLDRALQWLVAISRAIGAAGDGRDT